MNLNIPEISLIRPELIMLVSALAMLMLDLVTKRKEIIALVTVVFAILAGFAILNIGAGIAFMGMFIADGYGSFFKLLFLANLILTVMISLRYLETEGIHYGEYYSLLVFATLGMMLMASAGDLIVLYLGLELMALSTYVLAGFKRKSIKSNEAALKYFLLGAFASGFLLFGISLTYGITGTTEISAVAAYILEAGLSGNPVLLIALGLFIAAFSFKIAAVPFHMWAPDVYEGAPTSVTAFMSVGPKAAGFAAIGRVFLIAFAPVRADWTQALIPLAVLTMAVGNIAALVQTNIKRMLAYSSVAHAGYALLGIIAGGSDGMAGVMNYLLIYAFMNIGAFAIVIMLGRDELSDFEGLSKNHPLLAALMLLFMFSLTGIPPTAGFIGKFYVFMAALKAGHTWLVVFAVMMSAVSAYFYLRVVMYMYMREPKVEHGVQTSPAINTAVAVMALLVLIIGIVPTRFIEIAQFAASGF